MNYFVAGIPYSDELYHHGIKGQKWGIRRFQNPDGTRTEAGKKRYSMSESKTELGFDKKKHTNAVERKLSKDYSKSMKGYSRTQQRVEKKESKGKNVDKLTDKAEGFMNSAKMTKTMAQTYNSLTKAERNKINKGYRTVRRQTRDASWHSTLRPIKAGRMAGDTYLKAELLSRKQS